MKGAKGGARDRIISWLFSKKNQEVKEEETIDDQNKIKEYEEQQVEKDQPKILKEPEDKKVEVKEQRTTEDKKEEVITVEAIEKPETKVETLPPKTSVPLEQEEKIIVTTKNGQTITTIEDSEEVIKNPQVTTEEELVSTVPKEERRKEKKEQPIEIEENDQNTIIVNAAIIKEIEKIINQDYHDIQEIKYELELLQGRSENEVIYDEMIRIKEELDRLIKQFEEIKQRYYDLYKAIDLDKIDLVRDQYISPIISEYRQDINSTEALREIKEIEKYIQIINALVVIDKDKSKLQDDVDDKIEDLGVRDEEFEKVKNSLVKVEDLNASLDNYNKTINSLVSDLDAKIKEAGEITTTVNTIQMSVVNHTKILEATLLMAASSLIPPTRMGALLKVGLIASAATLIAHSVETKEKVNTTKTITFKDWEKDIVSGISTIESVDNTISQAFLDLRDIKNIFEGTCSEYIDSIPEYKEFYNNILKMEQELTHQKYIIEDYNKNMNNILTENNNKVKKIEEDYEN